MNPLIIPKTGDWRHRFEFVDAAGAAEDISTATPTLTLRHQATAAVVVLTIGAGLTQDGPTNSFDVDYKKAALAGWAVGPWVIDINLLWPDEYDDAAASMPASVRASGAPADGGVTEVQRQADGTRIVRVTSGPPGAGFTPDGVEGAVYFVTDNPRQPEARLIEKDDVQGLTADLAAAAAHAESIANPHGVTKAQVGLGNADDTADLDKPLSNAAVTALAGKVSKSGATMLGALLFAVGSAAAPGAAFAGDPASGFYQPATGVVGAVAAGAEIQRWRAGGSDVTGALNVSGAITSTGAGLSAAAASGIGWTGSTTLTAPADGSVKIAKNDGSAGVTLVAPANHVLSLRDGTNPQTFYAHNTWSAAGSNYERGEFGWVSNVLEVGTANAGATTARNVRVKAGGAASVLVSTNSVDRWQFGASGSFTAVAHATYNIGTSVSAGAPNNIYAAANVVAGGYLGVSGAAASNRLVQLYTGSNLRWTFGALNGAEAGANAGSDFGVLAYDDAGSFLTTPFAITRATGYVGLGQTSPKARLHVSGDIALSISRGLFFNVYYDGSNWRTIGGSGYNGSIIHSGSTGSFYFATTAAQTATDAVASITNRWELTKDGHWFASADNAYDWGAAGASRPRDVNVARNIIAGGSITTGAYFKFANGAQMLSPSVNDLTLYNSTSSGFGLLQLGGPGATFPAIGISGTQIRFRLADGSAYTSIRATSIALNGGQYIDASSTTGFIFSDSSSANYGHLHADGVNALALRNGANANDFRIYKSIVGADYERAKIYWSGTQFYIATEGSGTGIQRSLRLDGADVGIQVAGTTRWLFNSSGYLTPSADVTYDIGAVGGRVRGFIGRQVDLSYSSDGGQAIVVVNSSTGTSARTGVQLTNDGGSLAFVALHGSGTAAGIGRPNSMVIQGPYAAGVAIHASHASGVIEFVTGGTSSGNTRWKIDASGHLIGNADNTYDIATGGANRPRNVYVASGVYCPNFNFTSGGGTLRGSISSPIDGIFSLYNAAGTGFTGLKLGGVTSSFPFIKAVGAGIQIRDAADGAMSSLECSTLDTTGAIRSAARVHAYYATAIPAGGAVATGLMMSSAAGFGIFFGSGAPTVTAAKSSLYLRSDATNSNERVYVNTDGGTTWTNMTAAA